MRRPDAWTTAGLLLAALGVAIRVNNAIAYKVFWGFDELGNWGYVRRLMRSWELPAPDAGWSTSHPPLFYYLVGALGRALGEPDRWSIFISARLISSAIGVLAVGLAVLLVHRADPGTRRRAFLAGALLLFLPVHIYMSAMMTEEILAASLSTAVIVGVALDLMAPPGRRRGALRLMLLGAAGGLALLTKLSGLLAISAAAGAYAIEGWRRGELVRPAARAALVAGVGLLVGGWWYARSWIEYGYLYPHALDRHRIMFTMPPGERHVEHYLYLPLATWTDPQLLNPDLLGSVWGSTYVTIWFDGHRHFLPRRSAAVNRAGSAILLLALLPTAAFVVGAVRGARRAIRSPHGPDLPLLLLAALTLSGYAAFTWQNPWFAAVKGGFMLGGLSAPFAFYASEALADWTRDRSARSVIIWATLGALLLLIVAVFTIGPVVRKPDLELVGLPWTEASPR